jgi:hypothetical protein
MTAFASSVQIHGMDNETILLCFADIRQVAFEFILID